MSMILSNGAPRLVGTILASDLQSVQDFYNNNYPDFDMNYTSGIVAGQVVTADIFNGFFRAMGACNTGWKGWTALPDKSTYSPGDVITEIQFKVPQSNFIPVINKEFFVSGNGSTNTFVVPPGCSYMHLKWLMGGGGAGGGAGKGAPFVTPQGGGSGAYIKDVWVKVQYNDQIIFNIGDRGYSGNRNWGTPGGDSTITIVRNSTGFRSTIFNAGGGRGGSNSWLGGIQDTYNYNGAAGVLNSTLGYTGYNGQHSSWWWTAGGTHTGSGGRDGGTSPLGTQGYGAGNNSRGGDASGYGAGGGSTGFYQGKHWSGDSDDTAGGNGAPGYGEADFLIEGPTDGSHVYQITDPTDNQAIQDLGSVSVGQSFNYGAGTFAFLVPNNMNYIYFNYISGPGGGGSRRQGGASGAYVTNSCLDVSSLNKPSVMTVQIAGGGGRYSGSSGSSLISIDSITVYNLQGGQGIGAGGSIFYTADPNNTKTGINGGGGGGSSNPGNISGYGNGGGRRGDGASGGVVFAFYDTPANLPSNALAVKVS